MFSYFYVTSSGFHGRSVILSSWNVFTPLGILKDWSISLPGTCAYNFHVFMNSWIHEIMTYQGTWKSGDQFHYQALVPTTFMFSWIHDLSRYMKIRWPYWYCITSELWLNAYGHESMLLCFSTFVLNSISLNCISV